MRRSILVHSLSLPLVLGIAACSTETYDTADIDIDIDRALAALPTLHTFEDWIAEHGYTLSADEQARYDAGDPLLGVVPVEDLPVSHEQSGVIEVPNEVLARHTAGQLDFRTDFAGWLAAGLYDPTSTEEREYAARHVRGNAGVSQPTNVGFMGDVVDAGAPPVAENNCKFVVKVVVGTPVNTPPKQTWADPSPRRHCDNYTAYSADHYIGGAPHLGAFANGGAFAGGDGIDMSYRCTQLAQTSNASFSHVTVSYKLTQEPLDPTKPMKCPAPLVEVQARGKATLMADLHVDFKKTKLFWNPIMVGWANEPWKGRAGGTVEAHVNNSNWRASATGEVQVGSDCQNSTGTSFSATAGPAAGASVAVSNSSTCSTQAWAASDLPRTQPLSASIDDVLVPLRSESENITAGYKALNFFAEAWSARPAEGRPSFSAWDMRSNAWAETRGGCIRITLMSCAPQVPADKVTCVIGGTGQASYTTSSGVDCPRFSVATPPVENVDAPPMPNK